MIHCILKGVLSCFCLAMLIFISNYTAVTFFLNLGDMKTDLHGNWRNASVKWLKTFEKACCGPSEDVKTKKHFIEVMINNIYI